MRSSKPSRPHCSLRLLVVLIVALGLCGCGTVRGVAGYAVKGVKKLANPDS